MPNGPVQCRSDAGGSNTRAVSDLLGIVLLFGIALLVIAATGVFAVVFHVPEPTTNNPSTEFSFTTEAAGGVLIIEHAGGDPIPADALQIQITGVTGVSSSTVYYWEDFSSSEAVREGDSIRLDQDALNLTEPAYFGEGAVELTVEDGEDAYRVGQWAGED